MKIRIGYVTNSSSTNFMIISKKELTAEYLYRKLGFKRNSILKDQAMELCENIINGTCVGLRWYKIDELNEDNVKEVFGEKAARIFAKKNAKGYFSYIGNTGSDEGVLTCFFTTDSFEIDENDFYLNARNCVW